MSDVSNNEQVEQENSGQESSSEDVVSYNTHNKLLRQKKNLDSKLQVQSQQIEELQEQINKFRQMEQDSQNKILEEKGEYEKLNEQLKSRLAKIEEQERVRKEQDIFSKKKDIFLKSLPGKLRHDDYLKLANFNDILVDPESGKIDEISAKDTADDFVKNHPHLIDSEAKSAPLPSESPKSGAATAPKNIENLSKQELMQLLSKI